MSSRAETIIVAARDMPDNNINDVKYQKFFLFLCPNAALGSVCV